MSFAHHPLGSPRQSQIGDPPVKSKALRVLLSKLLRWSVVGKRLGLHPAVHPHCHLMIWIRELNQKRRLIKDCVQHPLRFEEFDKTWIKAKVGTSPHFRLPLVRKMLDKNSYMLRLEPEWPECQRKWSKSRGLDTCGTWRIAISSRWTMSHLSSTPMLKVCRSCSNSECKALEWKKACSTSEYPAFQKQFWLCKESKPTAIRCTLILGKIVGITTATHPHRSNRGAASSWTLLLRLFSTRRKESAICIQYDTTQCLEQLANTCRPLRLQCNFARQFWPRKGRDFKVWLTSTCCEVSHVLQTVKKSVWLSIAWPFPNPSDISSFGPQSPSSNRTKQRITCLPSITHVGESGPNVVRYFST